MVSVAKGPAPLPKWFWLASLLGCTPGFKLSRCKRRLKVTMSRIKLLRGRREVLVRQLRRDVAQLLQLGQEENAESRLDRLWKEHSLLSAYIKIGEYCQLVKANLRNIAGQRECPVDLKEPLASLCFAASCCADLPELQEIRDIMVTKYGKDFLTSAHELLPGEHVNRLFLDAFSTQKPLEVSKKALLKGIIAEYSVAQPPRKTKPPCLDRGLQKTASSDCNISHKEQSSHERASDFDSCKQHPKLNALEQEEMHGKSPKQTKHSTTNPTCRAFTGEYASLPQVEGVCERKIVGQYKKDSHVQINTQQGGPNETNLASQDRTLRDLSHGRHGKEKSRNRLKGFKKSARVDQVLQEDQNTSSNRMPMYERTVPDESVSEFIQGSHGYRSSANERSSLEKDVKDFVCGQHDDFQTHAKHRKNKTSNEEYLTVTRQPWKHGYHDEALPEDSNAHQMLEEGNRNKHDYVEREGHSRSNGKARSRRVRHAVDNAQYEGELCHMDSNHAETKSKHYSKSNRKDGFTNEFNNIQHESSPHRTKHHMEGGTCMDFNYGENKSKHNSRSNRKDESTNEFDNVQQERSHRRSHHVQEGTQDIEHRINKTLRPGKMAYDNWQSPPLGYGIFLEEREPPHLDSNHKEPHSKHKNRSNEKSRPVRVTDELKNNKQERSPCRRNQHAEGETKIISDEISRPEKGAHETENWQSSPKGNWPLPDYADTHRVQRQNRKSSKKNHENDGSNALSGDHPKAHILQKGRKQHVREHHLEETQPETWADDSELVSPERATNKSHGNRYDPARQRDQNLHCTEDHFRAAKIENYRDHKEARQNGSALEPLLDGEHQFHHVHASEKHSARKHKSDHTDFTVKVLDGDGEPKQGRIAEEAVNGQMHWLGYTDKLFTAEEDNNYVSQREAHFPLRHHQFEEGCEVSVAVDARSLPHILNAHGTQKGQNGLKSLDEHEDLIAKLSSCERVKGNSSPTSRFSQPPQRPPPPVPPYRVSSLPNRKPLNSPSPCVFTRRCATLETGHARPNQEAHVHPKLPEYEDLVASFAALRKESIRHQV